MSTPSPLPELPHLFAVQTDITWEDKPATFGLVERLLEQQSIPAGSLVVLPEMFATGFSMHVDTIAETAEGPTHAFLARLATRLQSTVVGGVVTRAADGRGLNEAVGFGPDGQLLARYAKLHPFSFAGETRHYAPGEQLISFRWHDFTVAPFVCYDLRFPEAFRRATRRGAELLLVIANWPAARQAHWLALLVARAIENQAYVVGVNRVGSDPHAPYGGASLIVGPRGEILAQGSVAAEVLAAGLDRAGLLDYRRQFPALADIRTDLLGE